MTAAISRVQHNSAPTVNAFHMECMIAVQPPQRVSAAILSKTHNAHVRRGPSRSEQLRNCFSLFEDPPNWHMPLFEFFLREDQRTDVTY